MGKPCKHAKELKKMKPCVVPAELRETRVEYVRKVFERRGHSSFEIAEVLEEPRECPKDGKMKTEANCEACEYWTFSAFCDYKERKK